MGELPRFVVCFASGRQTDTPSIEEQQEAWRQDANNPDRGSYPLPRGPVLDSDHIEEVGHAEVEKPSPR